MIGQRPATVALVLAGILGIGACSESDDGAAIDRPPVRVQVVTVVPRAVPLGLSSVGSLASPKMTTVASEIEGRVVALDVPEGRRVEAGHVLARLDDAEARAALRVARARRTNARDRLRRLDSLRAESVSSEQAFEDAKSAYDEAVGEFDEARTRLERTTIVSPFAGVLGLRLVNPGQYVGRGAPIVELTQVDPLQLIFSIPQRFSGEVAIGQVVRGKVGSCGTRFEGVVEAIDPRVNPSTRSIQLQAVVENPDGALYPGMAVSLRLVTGEISDAIVVPQEAIIRHGTRYLVYRVDAEGHAHQASVQLGQFFTRGVHVTAGIEPGETVVVAGYQKLRPGAATQSVPFEPVDNPNLVLGYGGPGIACEPDG